MTVNHGGVELKAFPPLVSANSVVLILGSMPSVASLADHRYYAHPRNHFWIIMDTLLIPGENFEYATRCRNLIVNRIALWDVIAFCKRHGSLDAKIIEDSIRVNNFNAFFKRYRAIHSVFFNGSKAEQVYRRYVLHTLPTDIQLSYTRLPSSSPANANYSLSEKLKAWRSIKQKADMKTDIS